MGNTPPTNGLNNSTDDDSTTSTAIFIKRGESFGFNSPLYNKKNRINKVININI